MHYCRQLAETYAAIARRFSNMAADLPPGAFNRFYMPRDSTAWHCRAACMDWHAAGGSPICAYWTFSPPGAGGTTRASSLCFLAQIATLQRHDGWVAGRPVP